MAAPSASMTTGDYVAKRNGKTGVLLGKLADGARDELAVSFGIEREGRLCQMRQGS